jgi:hypothetical protein
MGGSELPQTYEVTGLDCWEWTGYLDSNGYGRAYEASAPIGRRVDWAHRVFYRRHRGDIPAGHDIDHLCENIRCVNPEHLEPVTKTEHAFRTVKRAGGHIRSAHAAHLRRTGMTYADIAAALKMAGRESAHGAVASAIVNGLVSPDDIPRVKHLTDAERSDIRDLYALGIPQTELAEWYGLDSSQVSRVCNGMTSGHGAAERYAS